VPDLPHAEVTLAEVLHNAGYFCAHIGKWHLGGFDHYPETMGFDVNIGGTGWGAPNTFWWPYRGAKTFHEYRYIPHLEWGRPGEYLTDRLTAEALKVIERVKDRPFFLYLCWHAVHTPIEGKPELTRKYERLTSPRLRHKNPAYAAMVETLDANVGRILDKLDELGLRDNTIVIFTSDNGGFINKNRGRAVTSNFPLRSGKGSLYEGGVRVPLIVRAPASARAGSVCAQPVNSCDFYPTLIDLIGLPRKRDANAADGRSFASLLKRPRSRRPPRPLFWHYPHYYPTTTPVSAVRLGPWKLLHYYEDDRVELYNLAEDLGEAKNLAETLPRRAAELRLLLDRRLSEVRAQMPRPNPRWTRPAQTPAKPRP
ncbi:MAG: sulfatase, partial [Verrucomicrobia bacterium]|nr:sulfatase [Verrucomicrobiota bacterium]